MTARQEARACLRLIGDPGEKTLLLARENQADFAGEVKEEQVLQAEEVGILETGIRVGKGNEVWPRYCVPRS